MNLQIILQPYWSKKNTRYLQQNREQPSFPGTPIPALPMNAVVGCELSNFGHVALIGRDLLRSFLLVYNGVEGTWTLAF